MSEERAYEEEERVAEPSGTSHGLAIGFYIAAVVLIFGTILVLYGILGPASQTQKSLGINLNLWWGLFMVAFGCVVLGMSWASPRRRAARRES
ncbi:MAG: hypothetical protein H0U55_16010 [Rubrobacteraceae bacterium]|nr:hypothetical protein [Rubrobacteraceae bacterium]